MKKKAKKIFDSLSYYAVKYKLPELNIAYRNGPRTDYNIDCRIEANLNRDTLIDMFGIKSQSVGPNMFKSKDIYSDLSVSARSHRKNGIDCLISDGNYAELSRIENETKRYGHTDISISYTRKK
jgi:hypothetical protein